jgi:transcriptional regulator GlxA family with amidase domain
LFDEVELLDVASVMHVASLAGRNYNYRPFRLLPVARAAGLIETRGQLRLEARFSLADCPPPEIVFVPGGYGARRAARDAELVAWCRGAVAQAELVLAVGAGVALLGAAGVLDGATVAASSDARAWLTHEYPGVSLEEREPVVTSLGGKLLTVARSGYAVELALAVVERFLGQRTAGALRINLGQPELARLDLPDPLTITLPPR